jgi:hypothetical protein
MQAGLALLTDHVARFNAGVRSGDFGPMVDGFTEDAEKPDLDREALEVAEPQPGQYLFSSQICICDRYRRTLGFSQVRSVAYAGVVGSRSLSEITCLRQLCPSALKLSSSWMRASSRSEPRKVGSYSKRSWSMS